MMHNLLFKIFLIFSTTLVITLLILPQLSRIASKTGLLDYPDANRKAHNNPEPLVGGLGMIIGFFLSCLLFSQLSGMWGFFGGVAILGVAGVLDDYKELNHRWKFVAQIIASILMIYFNKTVLLTFGDLFSFGQIITGMFAIPMSMVATVGVINSINMIDGLDGLAGGISLIAFISFGIFSYINNQTDLMLLSIALSGVVIAFLKYNWYPSKLFMGDAGSLFLGFSLTFLSLKVTQINGSHISPVAPLLILAVPIVDTITLMMKRTLKGKNPFKADKYHLHHILTRLGLDKNWTVKVILCVSVLFSCIAIVGTIAKIPEYYLFLVFITYFILYIISSFYIKNILKFKIKLAGRIYEIFDPTRRSKNEHTLIAESKNLKRTIRR